MSLHVSFELTWRDSHPGTLVTILPELLGMLADLVRPKSRGLGSSKVTLVTFVGFQLQVDRIDVILHVSLLSESFPTVVTFEWKDFLMNDLNMSFELGSVGKILLPALRALKLSLPLADGLVVPLHVVLPVKLHLASRAGILLPLVLLSLIHI